MRLMKTLILAFAVCPFFAHGTGGMTSSGGDNKHITWESAWFLGKEPIPYCIEVAPTEGLAVDKVKADFASVLKTWKDYYFSRALLRSELDLNFNFVYENCSPKTRLKIWVGIQNPEVSQAKQLYQQPYSLAYRKSYDMAAGMGTGFIWLAPSRSLFQNSFPDWSLPYTLHGMLLHEMGHVLGCGHVEGTIMEESIIGKLQTGSWGGPLWAAGAKMYLTNIDHHNILLLQKGTDLAYKGTIHPSKDEPRRVFELLTGRQAHGDITADVVKKGYNLDLIYRDDVGEVSFPMILNPFFVSEFNLGGQVFYGVKGETGKEGESAGGSFYTVNGYTFTTALKAFNGKSYIATVTINGSATGRPLLIKFWESENLISQAFAADLWLTNGIKH